MDAALAYAQRLADEKQDPQAKALLTSGYHDRAGRLWPGCSTRPGATERCGA